MGSSTENSAYGPTLNPWDTDARPRRLERRQRRLGRRGHRAVVDRHRHRRLDPPARRAVRDRRPQADLRRDQPLRDDRLRLLARPGGHVHPRRHRLARCCSARWSAPDPCDSTSIGLPEPIKPPTATDLKGIRLGVPEELSGEGIEPGVLTAFHETLELARALGATVETMHLPHSPHGARRLLPDRARRVLLEPRPLRRRALRLPRQGRAGRPARRCTPRRARQGFGAEVKRRIMLGTYALSSPATTTPTTARRRRSAR